MAKRANPVLKSNSLKSVGLALTVAGVASLSACSGTSTYGTGKTQEAQLFEDLSNIIPTASSQKKERIDYTSRPTLIKPPNSAALPQPVESTVSTNDGSFPEDPEIKAARIRGEAFEIDELATRSGNVPVEELTREKEGAVYSTRGRTTGADDLVASTSDFNATLDLSRSQKRRTEVVKAQAELAGAQGAAPRRYLTEPPAEYRTPADTAVAGDVGIDEADKNNGVKKKSLFSRLNPFD